MKSGRTQLIAGNWKMHGSLGANQALLQKVKDSWQARMNQSAPGQASVASVAVCVPFPYLAQVSAALSGSSIAWGAQTLSEHDSGAYTGEVSGAMLKEFGCRYAIVGHSERRQLYRESDAQVAAKFVAARRHGLTPILCVGETLEQREQGSTEGVVGSQLDAVIAAAGIASLGKAVLAYEPVWAIGTGRNATPEQAQAVHGFLRQRVAANDAAVAGRLTMLYGGSVKPGNAAELFAQADIDGGLIGGAALVAEDFIAICNSAGSSAGGRQ